MAEAAVQQHLMTEDDFLRYRRALPFHISVEIIDGEVVEMAAVGLMHHIVAGNIHRLLDAYAREKQSGIVFMDGLLCLVDVQPGGGLRGALVPDVCYIANGRIPAGYDLSRPFPGAPDVCIEVMSPEDGPQIIYKVRRYLARSAAMVLLLYPETQEVHRYHRDEPDVVRVQRGTDLLDFGGLLPGPAISAGACFEVPPFFTEGN